MIPGFIPPLELPPFASTNCGVVCSAADVVVLVVKLVDKLDAVAGLLIVDVVINVDVRGVVVKLLIVPLLLLLITVAGVVVVIVVVANALELLLNVTVLAALVVIVTVVDGVVATVIDVLGVNG